MKIINFIFENYSEIFIVFLLISPIVFLAANNNLSYLKAELFSLVNEAENIYGSKTGELKLMYVVKSIYKKMPLSFRTFMSENQLEKIIEKVLKKYKEFLKNNLVSTEGSLQCP